MGNNYLPAPSNYMASCLYRHESSAFHCTAYGHEIDNDSLRQSTSM